MFIFTLHSLLKKNIEDHNHKKVEEEIDGLVEMITEQKKNYKKKKKENEGKIKSYFMVQT